MADGRGDGGRRACLPACGRQATGREITELSWLNFGAVETHAEDREETEAAIVADETAGDQGNHEFHEQERNYGRS